MKKVKIFSKDVKITKSMQGFVEEKIERLEKHLPENSSIKVSVFTKKHRNRVTLDTLIGDKYIKAESIEDDFYDAIDSVIPKFKRQIDKYHDKQHSYNHKTIRYDEIEEEIYSEEPKEIVYEYLPKITKVKNLDKVPMSEVEAIKNMEELNHETFLFFNSDRNCESMIYKRLDGDYGLINIK